MEFYTTSGDRVGLRGMPPFIADLLRQLPRCIEQGADIAESRLFPLPAATADEETLRDDWKAHVQPELHDWFLGARQVVATDLRAMREKGGTFQLEFSLRHAEAWLNALNQARLTLAEVHAFDEKDLGSHLPAEIAGDRDLARFQIDFYAGIQFWLVELLDPAG